MLTEDQNYIELFKDSKTVRSENISLWRDIANHCGITIDENYLDSAESTSVSDPLDEDIYDPTAALSVTQSGDYLDGIMWGTGSEAVTIEPSEEVLQNADKSSLKAYYEFRTKQLLNNMNAREAGFSAARKPYFYSQMSFGTSGIGAFKNADYPTKEENPYFFRSFGVDNMTIAEGKNGLIDIIFLVYHWKVCQIMEEFDNNKTVIPKCVQDAYTSGDYNKNFTLVQGIVPRKSYDRGLKGKLGTKYKGVWFLDKEKENIFFTEDFRRLPVGVCRAIKIQGKAWGRSSGSLMISTIKSTNYMLDQAIQTIEKMNDPALGTFNNALFGDSVINTSSGGLVTFNEALQAKGQAPMFQLHDVGDPTGLISFLLPYLNDKITTGFKVDMLLDFSSGKDMTATEAMQRYAIRGKSLAGLLGQEKNEMLDVVVERCIQIEDDCGLCGIDPTDELMVKEKTSINRSDMVMPEAVAKAMKEGKRWYTIKYNNELEKMVKTEGLERIMQLINGISMLMSLYPQMGEAVQWYDLFNDINEALGVSYIKDADEFRKIIENDAKMRQEAMALQAAQAGAEIGQTISKGQKDDADAKR